MKKTQEQWAIEQLNRYGEVSRNGALSNYISRLGAIICNLNQSGWNIQGDWVKTEHGKDFIYKLISKPKAPHIEYKEVEGQRVAVLFN